MKTPTVEEELRHRHEADEARENLVDTLEEIRRRGHVVEDTIEANPVLPLLPLAIVGGAGLVVAVVLGDAIHGVRRAARRARRRRRMRALLPWLR